MNTTISSATSSRSTGVDNSIEESGAEGSIDASQMVSDLDNDPILQALGRLKEESRQEEGSASSGDSAVSDSTGAPSNLTWNGGTLTEKQLQIVAVLNLHKTDMGDIKRDSIQDRINDSNTPPDLKAALQGLAEDSTLFTAIGSQGDGKCGGKITGKDLDEFTNSHSQILTWNGGTLNDTQVQVVAILDRHKDKCPLSWDSLQSQANNKDTPPDLRAALQKLAEDPALFYAIGSRGDGKCRGQISAKDLGSFSDLHSQVKEFNVKQAENYVNNYIPSDGAQNQAPSVMTQNDALRELYRYSDYLPKKLNEETFKHIVEGTENIGKCPPQVIAAAMYFRQHGNEWRQLCQSNDANPTMGKSDLLEKASHAIHLTKDELKTVSTIKDNQDAFFGEGDITREKLAGMASDTKLSSAVRDAAKQLLQDPLLYGLMNNAKSGYKTKNGFFDFKGPTVDSGVIGKKDFQQFLDNMSQANKTTETRVTHSAKTEESQHALADMQMGIDDQPDIKAVKKSGGFLKHALDKALGIVGKVLDIGSTIIGSLSFIPGLGQIADLVSVAMAAEAQACNILKTIIDGGNIKKALIEAGINMAATGVGLIAGPEAKIAMREGLAKIVIEKAVNAGLDMAMSEAKQAADDYLMNLKDRLTTSASLSFSNVMGAVGGAAKETMNYAGNRLEEMKNSFTPQAAFNTVREGKEQLEESLNPKAQYEAWKSGMQFAL